MTNNGTRTILIVGNWNWDIYEEAIAAGFRTNNWTVEKFNHRDYMKDSKINNLQIRFKNGPAIEKINSLLIEKVKETKPETIFFMRTDLIFSNTLKYLKQGNPNITLILYHNDNPYLGLKNKIKWRHYLRCIRLADIALLYRPADIEAAEKLGAKKTALFLPNYISYLHKADISSNIIYDVVFIGHYEEERARIIDYLLENDINVKIYGQRWKDAKKYKRIANCSIQIALGNEYVKILNSSKIALVFLSKKNQDVYTRRCFEIPGCGTMMMAPRTSELETFFEDRKEAVFYDTKEDLLQKIQYYLSHDAERQLIAAAGRERCLKDGCDEVTRTAQLIELIEKVKSEKRGDIK